MRIPAIDSGMAARGSAQIFIKYFSKNFTIHCRQNISREHSDGLAARNSLVYIKEAAQRCKMLRE
jgi:hypothetical protein